MIAFINMSKGTYTKNTDTKSVELTEQCTDFYKNNYKLPQIVGGKDTKIIYDTQYVMVTYKDGNNSSTAIENYKNRNKYKDEKEIWSFVDLFDTEKKINRVIYVFEDNNNKEEKIVLIRDN